MAYTDERAGVPSTAEGEQWHEAPGDGADGGTSPDQGGPGPAGKPRHALEGGRVYWEIARRLAKPEQFVTFVVVAAAVVFTFVQFEPSNLFRNTTISGGDTGAHVILPWIAEHQLLPNLRLTGWTSSNWDGFPAVTFYFPLPIYSIVALAKVVPYNVAFKLGTAAPMILMPVAGWLMGRLAKAPFPVPAVLAAATLPYMFGTEYSIYGGNIPSTLAGEFAFSWSLWFALVFLGLVMRGLPTGRYRALAAAMFACTFMSHIDPTMFATMGLIVLILLYGLRNRDWRGALWWAVPTVVVGGFIAAWWALPFEVRFPYVTNMGYTRNTDFLAGLFPMSNPNDTWLFVLAAVGAVLSLANRRRIGEFFAIMGVLAALAFRFMPQSILWNNRVLPFWFLSLYLLAGLAVAELYWLLAQRSTNYLVTLRAAMLPAPLVVLVLVLVWVGFPLRILPGEHAVANGDYEFLGIPQKSESYIPSWISWNYSGYQAGCTSLATDPGQAASCAKTRWPEYEDIVAALGKISKTYGCGSLMWEYQSQMNNYGTPDALTTLPYWTNGCIGSMEGLYYEASATTPFHFIDQSELSLQPSDPMVGIPYASAPDVALGVQHLQMLGVKYYMALNTELQQQAAADPSLKLIDTLGPFEISYAGNTSGPTGTQRQFWKLYLVLGSPRVHPLANQPVVMSGLNNSSQPKYLKVMTSWYDNPTDWDVYLASSGPASWARIPYSGPATPVVWPQQLVKPEPSTTVSNIVEHNASISFDVSRTGVPVVVTISYFPNWQVSGATGPYRVSPNLMVVVPTSHHVSLSYGTTPVDYEGWGLSILGLLGLVVLVRRPVAPVRAVRRTGMVRLPVWAVDASFVGDAVKGAWGREPSPPPPYEQMGPASHNGAAGAHFGPSGHGNGATGEANGGPAAGEPAAGEPAAGEPAAGEPAQAGHEEQARPGPP
ncbi:MAG: hypothetical protein ACLQVK_14540 [Acidimicrobiales bacterium]